jgi:phage terminase small subunit
MIDRSTSSLTPKQARFVAEYLKDLNATQAAVRAGYSPKTAASQAHDLLRKPEIAAAVENGQGAQFQRLALDADEAMRINAEIARFDPAVLQDEAGNYKPLKDLPPEARRCIRRIRVHKRNLATGDGQTDLVIDYDFYDKHPAIDRDYKRNGLLKERLEISGTVDFEKKIAAVRQRLAALKAKG